MTAEALSAPKAVGTSSPMAIERLLSPSAEQIRDGHRQRLNDAVVQLVPFMGAQNLCMAMRSIRSFEDNHPILARENVHLLVRFCSEQRLMGLASDLFNEKVGLFWTKLSGCELSKLTLLRQLDSYIYFCTDFIPDAWMKSVDDVSKATSYSIGVIRRFLVADKIATDSPTTALEIQKLVVQWLRCLSRLSAPEQKNTVVALTLKTLNPSRDMGGSKALLKP